MLASLVLTEAGGSICNFDGNSPSPYKPSMYIAANNAENRDRILATVHKHLETLPY